ncbi:MAG TPA: hypothetical protein VGD40_23250 [Chryseosolibacter sp.]
MKAKNYTPACALLLAASFLLSACSNDVEEPTVTDSFQKIETSYRDGVEKDPATFTADKNETSAPVEHISALKEKILAEINSLQRTQGRFRVQTTLFDGYDVGVIPSGYVGTDCPSWSERITIMMDCEDSQSATNITGDPAGSAPWSSSWSVSWPNKNLTMVFCRVDGRLFHRDMKPGDGYFDYMVLRLGWQSEEYATVVTRYFDNEDSGNDNNYIGDLSPNIVNSNTTLSFYNYKGEYPHTGGYSWPELGFSYGVFGRHTNAQCCLFTSGGARVYSDDEDSRNANWLSPSNWYTNTLVANSNTTMYIARVK